MKEKGLVGDCGCECYCGSSCSFRQSFDCSMKKLANFFICIGSS